jgi:phage-related protein (TIGR01555 family)
LFRLDGLKNFFTLLGSKRDRQANSSHKWDWDGPLDIDQLTAIWRGNGIGRKIVQRPVFDMIRKGYKYENDPEGTLVQIHKDTKFQCALEKHLNYNRLYGGSLLIVGLDDGRKLDQPVNTKAIKKIDFLRVVSKYRIEINENDLEKDPESDRFMKPKFYKVQTFNGADYIVHHTRAFPLLGADKGDTDDQGSFNWGDSIINHGLTELNMLYSGYGATSNVLSDFIQTILAVPDLDLKMMQGKYEELHKRLELIDMGRSVNNTILTDPKEEYSKIVSDVNGIPAVLQEFYIALSAVYNIPVTILMGRSPAGENATGDSDFQGYYDSIAALQENDMRPIIDWYNSFVMLASEYKSLIKVDGEPSLKFNPLKQLTRKEEAEVKEINSKTDERYIKWNVLKPKEVRDSRYSGNEYSDDIVIEGDMQNPERDPNNTGE